MGMQKLCVLSILLIVLGLGILWIGLNQQPEQATLSPREASSAIFGIEGERVSVTEVVDGDTIKVGGKATIRLLGIDTPETKDPRKSVQCFGKEASNETKRLVDGKLVILEKDISSEDKYKRLLRYVYLPLDNGNLLFVNDYLIREGFARALTYPPDVKYAQDFLEAQREAKEKKRGLWGRC